MRSVPELLAAYAGALDRRFDGTTLQIMGGPHHVPAVGVIADVVWMDDESLEGPRSLLLLLAEASLGDVDAALDRLTSQVASLTRADLDQPLGDALGLAEIEAGTDLPIEHESSVRHPRVLARMQACAVQHAELSPWSIPPAIVGLAALFASPSTFERAAMNRLQLVPSRWLAVLAGGAPDIGAALTRALHDRGWLMPAELVPLFDDHAPGSILGFWYDQPGEPLAPVQFCRGHVQLLDGSLFETIAAWIERGLREPDLAALAAIELEALRAATDFFAKATGDHRERPANRAVITSGVAPALSREHGEPRWSTAEVATRRAAYQADDIQEISRLTALAERELGDGKPGFALVLGHELHARAVSTRSPAVSRLLVAAYSALGRGVYADLIAREDEALQREGSLSVILRARS